MASPINELAKLVAAEIGDPNLVIKENHNFLDNKDRLKHYLTYAGVKGIDYDLLHYDIDISSPNMLESFKKHFFKDGVYALANFSKIITSLKGLAKEHKLNGVIKIDSVGVTVDKPTLGRLGTRRYGNKFPAVYRIDAFHTSIFWNVLTDSFANNLNNQIGYGGILTIDSANKIFKTDVSAVLEKFKQAAPVFAANKAAEAKSTVSLVDELVAKVMKFTEDDWRKLIKRRPFLQDLILRHK